MNVKVVLLNEGEVGAPFHADALRMHDHRECGGPHDLGKRGKQEVQNLRR